MPSKKKSTYFNHTDKALVHTKSVSKYLYQAYYYYNPIVNDTVYICKNLHPHIVS
jgi:hypothetical protein